MTGGCPGTALAGYPLTADLAIRKESAIQAFTSQLTDRGPAAGPVLAAGIVAHFTRRHEVLLR